MRLAQKDLIIFFNLSCKIDSLNSSTNTTLRRMNSILPIIQLNKFYTIRFFKVLEDISYKFTFMKEKGVLDSEGAERVGGACFNNRSRENKSKGESQKAEKVRKYQDYCNFVELIKVEFLSKG